MGIILAALLIILVLELLCNYGMVKKILAFSSQVVNKKREDKKSERFLK